MDKKLKRHMKKKEERKKKKHNNDSEALSYSEPIYSVSDKKLAPLLFFGPPSSDDTITFFGEVDSTTSQLRRKIIDDFTTKLKKVILQLSVLVNFFDGYDSMTIVIENRNESDTKWAVANFNRPKPRFYYKKNRNSKFTQLAFVTDEEFFDFLRQKFPAYIGDLEK